MSNDNTPIGRVMLRNVRIAFTQLFEPKAVAGGDDKSEPRFGCVAIIDPRKHKDEIAALDKAIRAVAAAEWKDKAGDVLRELAKKDRICYKEGPKTNKSGETYDGFEGMHHVNASSPQSKRPTVIDRNKAPLTAKSGRPYAGCYANVNIDVWAQDNKWGRRINADLRGVQFVADGDSFGGGSVADETEFDDLGEGANAADMDGDDEPKAGGSRFA